jgi:hypothetical protein
VPSLATVGDHLLEAGDGPGEAGPAGGVGLAGASLCEDGAGDLVLAVDARERPDRAIAAELAGLGGEEVSGVANAAGSPLDGRL